MIFLADPVFLSHSLGREEYLQSDVGKIYIGTHQVIQGRPWIFGQKRDTVLPSVVHILDKLGKLKPNQRGDPLKVAKEVARIVSLGSFGFHATSAIYNRFFSFLAAIYGLCSTHNSISNTNSVQQTYPSYKNYQ